MAALLSRSRSSALRLEAGDPARITARAPVRFSGLSSITTVSSSPTRVSATAGSSSAAIKRRYRPAPGGPATMSRISRATKDSLPMRTTGPRLAKAGLQRGGRRSAVHAPPDDSADADEDSAGHVGGRHPQQERLRVVPDAVNHSGQQDQEQRLVRLVEIDAFEAVIAPGADHQKTQQ